MTEADMNQGWSIEEIEALEGFLIGSVDDDYDNGLDAPMGASEIDGFFCALVSGPQMVSPLVALRWVFDGDAGEQQPQLQDPAQAQWLMELLMKQWNATATALMAGPGEYQPLLNWRTVEGRGEVPVIDEWCWGYCKGMALTRELWQPLATAHPEWLATMLLYGTDEGWAKLEKEPLSDSEHEALAGELDLLAWKIHDYWLQRRGDAPMPLLASGSPPRRRSEPKIGRNEACHCGSGRKYKHCHGAG